MTTATKRHPTIPHSRVALSEQRGEQQIMKGLYTTQRGESFPLPLDSLKEPGTYLNREMWERSPVEQRCPDHPDSVIEGGRCEPRHTSAPLVMSSVLSALGIQADAAIKRHAIVFGEGSCLWAPDTSTMLVHRTGVQFRAPGTVFHSRVLTELRERDNEIPAMYYHATLGHDLHVSTWGDLYARHWHAGWADPFTGETTESLDPTFNALKETHFVSHECDLPVCPQAIWGTWDKALDVLSAHRGFVENCGWVSGGKVTDAFVSEEIDELVSDTGTEYNDFNFHEVGLGSTAENNNDTALETTSGITRQAGTQVDVDPIYRTVDTQTADATETWEELGIFNNVTGAALMDRNLTSGQSVASPDTVEYTYELTKNPEA